MSAHVQIIRPGGHSMTPTPNWMGGSVKSHSGRKIWVELSPTQRKRLKRCVPTHSSHLPQYTFKYAYKYAQVHPLTRTDPPPPQLTETKERCEKALEEKALPLDVVLECLSLREQRVSIDLVRDDVEAELHKVSGMVAGLTDYYGHPMIAYAVIQFQCIYELFVFCCRSLRRSKGSGALSMRMLTLHLSKSVCCRTVTKGFALTSQTNTQHWPLTQNAWTSQISLRPFHSRRTPHALRRSELHC